MENLVVNHQKTKQKYWIDETGHKVDYKRTTKFERVTEKHAAKAFNEALKVHEKIKSFKETISEMCTEVYEAYLKDKDLDKVGKGKGNFTWFNFDRTIKVEMAIKERVTFDEIGIQAAKDKLNEFLDENIDSKDRMIKDLVNDAFSTSRGKLDAKKVFNLTRYRAKIRHKKFQEALNLIEESIRRPESKQYFRIYALDEQGEYQSIDLNFSSI